MEDVEGEHFYQSCPSQFQEGTSWSLESDCESDILVRRVVFRRFAWDSVFRRNIMSPKVMNIAKFLLVVAFCSFLGGTTFIANAFVTDESDLIYGRGVHAFFDRDYERAITILLQAKEMGSVDPRPFYFLGLAHLRQDKTELADQFFKQAAELEFSRRAARDYGVAEALRRIQGEERLRIESIRTEERANAQIREQQFLEARYGRESAADREILRQSTSQNQREDLAVLQRMAGNFGENAFGVRPIDPINTVEEPAVVARRVDSNPFGEVVAPISEVPVLPDPTPAIIRTTVTPAGPVRTFVNPDVAEAERIGGGNQPAITVSPASLMMQGAPAAAREIGRGLGTLFSRRAGE
jgi:hypothetical protein